MKNGEKFNLSDSFFTYVIHFSGQSCFLSTPQLSFALAQLSTRHILIINNNYLSVLFRPLVSSANDERFQSTFVFYQAVLKNALRVLQCM